MSRKLVGIVTADSMTEIQMIALVKEYYYKSLWLKKYNLNRKRIGHKRNIKSTRSQKVIIGSILVIAMFLIYFIFLKKDGNSDKITVIKPYEPSFVKEGALYFLDSTGADTISQIVIEIADNNYDRARGLMHRRSMLDSVGMLFVFDEEKPQGFWMRNTYFSLDIIFVNSQFEIGSIQKYTQPFSEMSLSSKVPAMYVVEVNAGYCDKNGIEAGDRIVFSTQNNEFNR